MAVLRCVNGCEGDHDIFHPRFSCPSCGGLVDVEHDIERMKRRSAAEWHQLLVERSSSTFPLDRSGVWAHREWVMPDLKTRDVVTTGEGFSPLLEVPDLAKPAGVGRVFVKQCGQSLTGSFKDLGMTVLVSMALAMKRQGRDVRALVCASTGDTSAALAAYGARAGIPVVVLLPRGKITPAQLVQPLANGAHVLALDGDFDACMQVVQQVTELPGMFLANSKNPLRIEGQKTVAFEIARDLGWAVPDLVLVPSGNLGNVSALEKGFSLLKELGLTDRVPRLVACQVDAANPLYRAFMSGLDELQPVTAQDTQASAIRIGNPVSWPRAKRALERTGGIVTSVSEAELLRAQATGDRAGLFTCPHTATAIAGLLSLGETEFTSADMSAVVVSTAHGLKFTEQKAAFHDGGHALEGLSVPEDVAGLRNPPVFMEASVDAVQRALDERLGA
jgi:threonine synthase